MLIGARSRSAPPPTAGPRSCCSVPARGRHDDSAQGAHPARRRPPDRPARPAAGPRRPARLRGRRPRRTTAPRRSSGRWPATSHLAILDVSMPRMTGLQAAREITQRAPDVRVLMLSMHDNEEYLFEALAAGASGYVLKTAADRDLVDACRAAMRGEPFLYPGACARSIREHLERARRGETGAHRSAHAARAGDRQADRRGAHQRRDRRAAGHQQEDRRAPPREHPREARDARPRRAHALRDPPRARRALRRPRMGRGLHGHRARGVAGLDIDAALPPRGVAGDPRRKDSRVAPR